MAKEIEAKFLNINKQELIKKLEDIGARKVYDERMMRRCVYNLPKDGAWARIRDEGDKVTISYKCVTKNALDGVEEVQIEIDNFDRGRELLKELGHIEKAYQETFRMRYFLDEGEVEFDIDTWPALNTFLEIEAPTEEAVKSAAAKLGFDWSDAKFGAADSVYAGEYNVTEDWIDNDCPLLVFGHLPAELSDENRRIK